MKINFYLMISLAVFLSACSTTQRAYQQNIQLYFSSKENIELSKQIVSEAPVDLIYIKSGERPYATMALAFIENNHYKWLSADDVMLITQNGRLVRTLGLDKNLIYVGNLETDPMASKAQISKHANWNSHIDLDADRYGIELTSHFEVEDNVSLTILEQQFVTTKVVESVTTQSVGAGSENWQNVYWYHAKTGQLLRSNQQFSATSDRYDILYVSRAMRILEPAND